MQTSPRTNPPSTSPSGTHFGHPPPPPSPAATAVAAKNKTHCWHTPAASVNPCHWHTPPPFPPPQPPTPFAAALFSDLQAAATPTNLQREYAIAHTRRRCSVWAAVSRSLHHGARHGCSVRAVQPTAPAPSASSHASWLGSLIEAAAAHKYNEAFTSHHWEN